MHQGLRLLNEHRVATGSAAMALFALTLLLLPRIILPFVLGMIASPILILVTTVGPCPSPSFSAGSHAGCWAALSWSHVQVLLFQSMNQAEKARPDTAPRTLPFQGKSESEGPSMEYIMDTVVQGLAKVLHWPPSSLYLHVMRVWEPLQAAGSND